jgi:hypothetical protein
MDLPKLPMSDETRQSRESTAKAPLVILRTGDQYSGELVPITHEGLRQARQSWTAKFRLRSAAGIVDEDYELWTRGFLRDACQAESLPPGYFLIADGGWQGIVIFDGLLRPSRRANGCHVLQIQYLATAPWNRPAGDRAGKFRGVGRALVRQAVRESIRRGTPGRVGVQAYVNSTPFFEGATFENLGTDEVGQGLVYFELRPLAAFELL